jgi:hypothetical protein
MEEIFVCDKKKSGGSKCDGELEGKAAILKTGAEDVYRAKRQGEASGSLL